MSDITTALNEMNLPLEPMVLGSAQPTLGTPRAGRLARAARVARAGGDVTEAAGNVAAVVTVVQNAQALAAAGGQPAAFSVPLN
ncbi:hypothetical protein [Streptomyces sp. 4F14]|uniref:hypothetical protein n=1 Tax=Streptomyces sp. 4F14 TaxID=3394380 RepID=UPI003A84FE4E